MGDVPTAVSTAEEKGVTGRSKIGPLWHDEDSVAFLSVGPRIIARCMRCHTAIGFPDGFHLNLSEGSGGPIRRANHQHQHLGQITDGHGETR